MITEKGKGLAVEDLVSGPTIQYPVHIRHIFNVFLKLCGKSGFFIPVLGRI